MIWLFAGNINRVCGFFYGGCKTRFYVTTLLSILNKVGYLLNYKCVSINKGYNSFT